MLPASGQISLNNVRTETDQSTMSNYWLGSASAGVKDYYNGKYFTPINVHTGNTDDYPVGYPINFSEWYSYEHTRSYLSNGINRSLFLSYGNASVCYATSMIIFDLGTSNTTWDITISGSNDDFAYIDVLYLYYGKPWTSNGTTTGSYAPIQTYFVNQTGLNTTYNYSYTYDSGRGQYLYVVVEAGCY